MLHLSEFKKRFVRRLEGIFCNSRKTEEWTHNWTMAWKSVNWVVLWKIWLCCNQIVKCQGHIVSTHYSVGELYPSVITCNVLRFNLYIYRQYLCAILWTSLTVNTSVWSSCTPALMQDLDVGSNELWQVALYFCWQDSVRNFLNSLMSFQVVKSDQGWRWNWTDLAHSQGVENHHPFFPLHSGKVKA